MQNDPLYPQQPQPPYYQPQPGQSSFQQSQPPYYQPQPGQPSFQQPYMPPVPVTPVRKPRRWPWIVMIILAFLVGYSLGHVGTSSSTADTTTTNSTTGSTATTTASTIKSGVTASVNTTAHHKIGETVSVDNKWDITVNGVSTSQGDSITQPKAGNTFLLITVTFKNISGQQQVMSSLLSFTLRGPDGQNYTQSLFTGQSMPDGTVASGALTKGTLSYEVPTTVQTYTLNYADLGGQLQTWDISKA